MKTSDALEIEISNLGPIVEAKVDLRPFTVFVGPSNTGKSYLATMIYVLHLLFSGATRGISSPQRELFERHSIHAWNRQQRYRMLSSDAEVKDLLDWATQMAIDTELARVPEKFPTPLPERIAALIRPLFDPAGDFDEAAKAEVIRCFGLQVARHLVRKPGTKGTQVILRRHIGIANEKANPFVYELDISERGMTHFSAAIPVDQPLYYGSNLTKQVAQEGIDPISKENRRAQAFMLIERLVDAVFPYIVGPVSLPAHYLPANRAGLIHAHKIVASALIEGATNARIHSASPAPMLSGVLADFLKQLIALGDLMPDRDQGKDNLAVQLEKRLLGGTVHQERKTKFAGAIPSFSYRPHGWKQSLPMIRTSSMVAELAPVVLYLRHVVRKDDVLIIEEPESHLHPEMQVEFTRFLASVVRSGVRIIMTTHSEWVLEELANLIQASELSESQREAINGNDIALREDEVGAWLFQSKKRPKGSVVQEIPLNRESGTFAAGYDQVAADVYNRWVKISSRSNESEEK